VIEVIELVGLDVAIWHPGRPELYEGVHTYWTHSITDSVARKGNLKGQMSPGINCGEKRKNDTRDFGHIC
jgi:hypothetical protein